MKKIILASQSPRRRELLSRGGFDFEVIPSEKEEIITDNRPCDIVKDLSRNKAIDVHDIIKEKYGYNTHDYIIIGADTIVVFNDSVLGKPKDKYDAYRMLDMLQGRTHTVYTGVTIMYNEQKTERYYSFYEDTDVTFYPMTDEEIWHYIETGLPLDKAGAYGIQDSCALYIKEIRGDYNNVVGLPLGRLYQEMKKLLLI